MNIGEYSVRTPVVSWLLVVVFLVGGIYGFQNIGRLEDPAFTIKMAKIITQYPGASAQEVYDEVTYHLEDAVQRMPQLKDIYMSVSRPGLSDIKIEFKDEYGSEELPNVFDELRRKVADVQSSLPPDALAPMVIDDFGDVYGVYFMLTGEGYSWRDLYDVADDIKRQLVLIDGVRKVSIDGEQREVVYLDIARSRLA
ncbi:MAG: efflux RND transporter permease subunit, partial [Pseudomonadota bacterium]